MPDTSDTDLIVNKHKSDSSDCDTIVFHGWPEEINLASDEWTMSKKLCGTGVLVPSSDVFTSSDHAKHVRHWPDTRQTHIRLIWLEHDRLPWVTRINKLCFRRVNDESKISVEQGYNAYVPLTILTSSGAHLILKMRQFQRSDEFHKNLKCYHTLNVRGNARQASNLMEIRHWSPPSDERLVAGGICPPLLFAGFNLSICGQIVIREWPDTNQTLPTLGWHQSDKSITIHRVVRY